MRRSDEGESFHACSQEMSRRKQGRPQQRKLQHSMEQDNDLLVCGGCRKNFPLQDIVDFIRHKKLCCNKENCRDGSLQQVPPMSGEPNSHKLHNHMDGRGGRGGDEEDDEDGDDEMEEEDDEAGTGNDVGDEENDNIPCVTRKKHGIELGARISSSKPRTNMTQAAIVQTRAPLRPRQVVDAESNTTLSEPSRFVCETCRSTYTSAWALLQHAQQEHGMKIYTNPPALGNDPSLAALGGLDLRSTTATRSTSVPFASLVTSNPFTAQLRLPPALSPFTRPPALDVNLFNDLRRCPPPLTRAPSDNTAFSRATAESQETFYSTRLKQLASIPALSPAKPQPSASNLSVVALAPASPPREVLSISTTAEVSPSSSASLPQQQRACEFCGKTFRFQSNLVVHRRSHTGEKPFKCPHCPHACTQQSKLTRHLKTHTQKLEGESAAVDSDKKTADDEGNDNDDDSDDDDDEEEEEEEEEEENEVDEEDQEENRTERLMFTHGTQESSQDREKVKGTTREEYGPEAKRIKIEATFGLAGDLSSKSKRPGRSLLSEVMKRTGLHDIQTYSEAYRAALAESREKRKESQSTPGKGDGRDQNDGGDHSNLTRKISDDSPARIKQELESEEVEEEDNRTEEQQPATVISGSALLSQLAKDSMAATWPTGTEVVSGLDPSSAALSVYSQLYPSLFQGDGSAVRFILPSYASVPSTGSALTPDTKIMPTSLLKSTLTTTNSSSNNQQQQIFASQFLLTTTVTNNNNNSNSSSSNNNSATSPLVVNVASSTPTPRSSLITNGNGVVVATALSPISIKKDTRRNDTCEYCGKVFKNCSNLTVHRRSHTGEKPYKCNLCSYACAQSSKLTRHMKTHGRQGKDVFTCKFCDMPFSVPSTLEKHMRKCVGNKNYTFMIADISELSSDSDEQQDSASATC